MSNFNTKKFIYNDYFIIFCVIILPWILLYTLDFKPKLFGDGEYIRESKLLVGLIKSKISFEDFYFTEGLFTIIYYAIPFSLISYNSTNETYLIVAQLFNLIILIISFRLLLKLCFILKINKILFVIISLLYPIHIYYSFGILSEIPIFFTICVALYYFYKFKIQDNRSSFIVFSIFIFLSVSIRPNLILLLVLLVALMYHNRKLLKFNFLLKNFLILTLLFAIVLFSSLKFGKSVTSKLQKNQLDLLSFGAVMSTFQFFDEPTNWNFFNKEYREKSKDYSNWIRSLDSLENHIETNNLVYNKVFFSYFFKRWYNHPLKLMKSTIVRFFHLHIQRYNKTSSKAIYINAYFFIISLFFLITIIIFFSNKDNLNTHYILFFLWFVNFSFFLILPSEARYLFPSRPIFLIILSMYISNFSKSK